uniref:Phage protein n=1 Tax=Romanomermis culicivorax TaxID=13658 RepID=A0A915HG17_ROMCU
MTMTVFRYSKLLYDHKYLSDEQLERTMQYKCELWSKIPNLGDHPQYELQYERYEVQYERRDIIGGAI